MATNDFNIEFYKDLGLQAFTPSAAPTVVKKINMNSF